MSNKHIFISYRRDGGKFLARNVKEGLEKRKFKVFMDIEDLKERKGPFPEKIYKAIDDSSDLVVILTPGSLDRCRNEGDWVRKEIAYGLKKEKNIVPVIERDFVWPNSLPEEIEEIPNYQGLEPTHDYFEASMDRLAYLLKGHRSATKKYWGAGFFLLTGIIVSAFVYFQHLSAKSCDQYLCVDVPEKNVGTLLSEKAYDLKMLLENRTSTEIYISEITAKKFNSDAAEKLGLDHSLIHVGEFHGPMPIEPHGKKEIVIIGNEILPVKAEISILHSQSGTPSVFDLALPHEQLEMPAPRVLPDNVVFSGTDGIGAIRTALTDAEQSNSNAHVIAAFPGESSDFLDPQSRLKAKKIISWVVTLFLTDKDQYYTAIIEDGEIVDKQIYPPQDQSFIDNRNPTPIPVIGNQKALEIANSNNLICGNWKDLRLSNIKLADKWSLAWFLPYRGHDSFPIIVDALSGKLLIMGKGGSFDEVSAQDSR